MRRRDVMALGVTAAGAGLVSTGGGGWAVAQTVPPSSPMAPSSSAPTSAATTSTGASSAQPFSAAQLDQMMAPIALYPDPLLAQMLMAATYPLEVVEAARWSKDNPNLKVEAALAAVKDKGWDVSVTSLVAFPQVLAMMNSKLDWTQKIGDAMIAQQSDVAASIQRLRAQSQAAGMLKSTPQQTVTSQPASAGAPAGTPAAIVIQPTNPDVVYVPTYDTNAVYGSWPYANNPPDDYPPPSYGWGWSGALVGGFGFGVGFGIGGAFFGGWSWGVAGAAVGAGAVGAAGVTATATPPSTSTARPTSPTTSTSIITITDVGSTIRRIATASPIATATAGRSMTSIIPTPPSARPSAGGSTTSRGPTNRTTPAGAATRTAAPQDGAVTTGTTPIGQATIVEAMPGAMEAAGDTMAA